jgi:hypothetical protein
MPVGDWVHLIRKEEECGLSWVDQFRFAKWMEKHATQVVLAVNAAHDEVFDKGAKFGELIMTTIQKKYDGVITNENLDKAFDHLKDIGLIRKPAEPKPAAKPEHERRLELQYTLILHPQGAANKVLGQFSGAEVISRIKKLAAGGNQSAFEIVRDDGTKVDMDLIPIFDTPLARAQQSNEPQQSEYIKGIYREGREREYLEFFNHNTSFAVKQRAAKDSGFRSWLGGNLEKEWQHATAGIDELGNPVQVRKL